MRCNYAIKFKIRVQIKLKFEYFLETWCKSNNLSNAKKLVHHGWTDSRTGIVKQISNFSSNALKVLWLTFIIYNLRWRILDYGWSECLYKFHSNLFSFHPIFPTLIFQFYQFSYFFKCTVFHFPFLFSSLSHFFIAFSYFYKNAIYVCELNMFFFSWNCAHTQGLIQEARDLRRLRVLEHISPLKSILLKFEQIIT